DYQTEAVRLFSTLREAYKALNSVSGFELILNPLRKRDIRIYQSRTDWNVIEEIPDERLPDLGYISAARVKQETAERSALKNFLAELAKRLRKEGPQALDAVGIKILRRMDSLLRKFKS